MPLECRDLEETFIHAYVDGEFSSDDSAEVKAHLAGCEACAREVRIQESYKTAAERANVDAPHQLYQTVRERLAAEPHKGRWGRALRDPRAVGIAAAVVGTAAWFLAGGLTHPIWQSPRSYVDDGVALHARALPLDYTASDVGSAQRWLSEKLDFGVRIPRFSKQGPHLEGVRLSQVRSRQAAVVTYTVPQGNGRRVSLLIVDDPEPQLQGNARRIADREIWLSRARGFNIASWRNDEIVYSLISDLDEKDILALVASAELR
jgi:anti-sigma factor RsiW